MKAIPGGHYNVHDRQDIGATHSLPILPRTGCMRITMYEDADDLARLINTRVDGCLSGEDCARRFAKEVVAELSVVEFSTSRRVLERTIRDKLTMTDRLREIVVRSFDLQAGTSALPTSEIQIWVLMAFLLGILDQVLSRLVSSPSLSLESANAIYPILRPVARFIPSGFPILDVVDPLVEAKEFIIPGLRYFGSPKAMERTRIPAREALLDLASVFYHALQIHKNDEAKRFALLLQEFVSEHELITRPVQYCSGSA